MAFIANQASKVGAGSTWNYLGSVASKVGTKISKAVKKKDSATEEFEIKEDEDWAIDWTKGGNQLQMHTSMMPYHSARQSLQRYAQKLQLRTLDTSLKMAKECAYLANWIYLVDIPLFGFDAFDYRKVVKSNKSTQVAQWLFLYSAERKTAFLVFKGTDVDNPQDILTDLGIIPYPIYPKKGEKEISGHALMEAAITRDYDNIVEEISSKDIDDLYICGHSLGGGLAIMFGLKAIVDEVLPFKAKPDTSSVHIITFAAPSVIAIEKDMDQLSPKSKQYLDTLHAFTHCFVNAFDIVPRLLCASGVKWMDFISKATYKYVQNWRQKIMNQAQNKVHEYVLAQNMSQEQRTQNKVGYAANQVKADVIGVLGQSAVSLVKSMGNAVQKGTNLAKGEDAALAVSLKIIEFTQDEYHMEDEKVADYGMQHGQQQTCMDTFASFEGIIEAAKKSARNNLLLYHPMGTFYFCLDESEQGAFIADTRELSEQMLSYIPARLSFSTENMQMLLRNHLITGYLQLFEAPSKSRVPVTGYLDGILKEIQDGKPCGSGDMFWLVKDKKYTPIGKLCLEQHIGDGSQMMKGIRERAFWSKHSMNWRIRFNVWGYAKSNVEIAVANSYDELRPIFDRY